MVAFDWIPVRRSFESDHHRPIIAFFHLCLDTVTRTLSNARWGRKSDQLETKKIFRNCNQNFKCTMNSNLLLRASANWFLSTFDAGGDSEAARPWIHWNPLSAEEFNQRIISVACGPTQSAPSISCKLPCGSNLQPWNSNRENPFWTASTTQDCTFDVTVATKVNFVACCALTLGDRTNSWPKALGRFNTMSPWYHEVGIPPGFMIQNPSECIQSW